jgi:hypothetical protein
VPWRRALALAAVLVLGWASPAAAHGDGGPDASNYRSEITGGRLDGVRWRVVGPDAYLQLTVEPGRRVVVLGYEGEPYLRFDDDGVFENRRSPAAYLNAERFGGVAPPSSADPEAPPRWRRVSSGRSYRWHDHRIHWMSPRPPAVVRADGDREHVVSRWTVDHVVDGRPAALQGTLRWLPSRPAWPWLAALGVGVAVVVALGLGTRPVGGRWPRLARPAAGVLLLAAAATVVGAVDDVLASSASATDDVTTVVVAVAAASVVALAARRGWTADDTGFGALAVGGLVVAYAAGISQLETLTAPVLVTELPDVVTPICTTLALAAGATGVVAAVLAERRFGTFFGRLGR